MTNFADAPERNNINGNVSGYRVPKGLEREQGVASMVGAIGVKGPSEK
jgi:hypothetical protein